MGLPTFVKRLEQALHARILCCVRTWHFNPAMSITIDEAESVHPHFRLFFCFTVGMHKNVPNERIMGTLIY
jgi:hypothetical protein